MTSTAKKNTPATPTAEFPKPLVRLRPVAGGYDAEVRMVADAASETAAQVEGFQQVAVPAHGPDFAEYPKWLYHADGRSVVVQNADEEARQEGFTDTPPAPDAEANTVEGDLPRGKRPPVPADRG